MDDPNDPYSRENLSWNWWRGGPAWRPFSGRRVRRWPDRPSTTTAAPLLDRLIAQGRAIPASNLGPIPPTPARDASDEGVSLSVALAEARDGERY